MTGSTIVAATIFPNVHAITATVEHHTVDEWADRCRTISAETKGDLPLLKLARFGGARSSANSLRTNDNIEEIFGIEADYDGEQMTPRGAREHIALYGIGAVVYTSPSHTEDKPRWRVLCPLSKPAPPKERAGLVDRLNGALGGVLARESWTLSQSFYFGSIKDSQSHEVHVLDGTPLDLLGHLDEIAIGKPRDPKREDADAATCGRQAGPLEGDGTRYGLAALKSATNNIAGARPGSQNFTLNAESYTIGQLVGGGELVEERAISQLIAAGGAMCSDPTRRKWNSREIDSIVRRAFRQGVSRPREAPQRVSGERPAYDGSGNGAHAPEEPQENGSDEKVEAELYADPTAPDPWGAGDTFHGKPTKEKGAEPPGNEALKNDEAAKAERARKEARRIKLRARTSACSLIHRDLPPDEPLLGSLVTKTSRMFLVARTGTGKTLLGLAFAGGVAAGAGFLGWKSARPARTLYIDGEMSLKVMQARLCDLARRMGGEEALALLDYVSWEDADTLGLGKWMPLNSEEGQAFVRNLCEVLDPDVIILDNVQSLIVGDMKDEVPWNETLPLVGWLTANHIGQIWIDHTGHNTTRQYGSSTKGWRMDTIGVMKPLPREECAPGETAFTFSFDPPFGKARNRSPETWDEYNTQTIRLRDDLWTSDLVGCRSASLGNVKPSRRPFYDALTVAISRAPGGHRDQTTLAAWEEACISRGIMEPRGGPMKEENRTGGFRAAKSDLLAARWIAIEGGTRVIDLKHRYC